MPLPGAKVVWGPSWSNVPHNEKITIVEYFKPYCDGKITIFAAADNAFKIFLNGVQVLSGNVL